YAWSLQNFRLLFSDLPQPPTIISRRDVRDRVDAFVPFFLQGRRIEPILLGDSLYWSVDLYAASETYPLSRHFNFAGVERSYVRHAAVAVVHGTTGDIVVVPDSAPDPVTTSWIRRLPSLFGSWSALPASLRVSLPPPLDGVLVQANAFGRYGRRADNDVQRHVP